MPVLSEHHVGERSPELIPVLPRLSLGNQHGTGRLKKPILTQKTGNNSAAGLAFGATRPATLPPRRRLAATAGHLLLRLLFRLDDAVVVCVVVLRFLDRRREPT